MRDETQVLIIFSDSFDNPDNISTDSTEIELISSTESEQLKLDDFDVTISTIEKYEKELAIQHTEDDKSFQSAFFDSEPVDIGYTDAGMLDNIIGRRKK